MLGNSNGGRDDTGAAQTGVASTQPLILSALRTPMLRSESLSKDERPPARVSRVACLDVVVGRGALPYGVQMEKNTGGAK